MEMIYQKHIPKFPLNNYIDSIIYIEGNNKGTGLPKTAMSLVYNLNDDFKLFIDNSFTDFINYKKYWVAGFQTKPTFVESYGTSKMIVVQFKTAGAFVFLNQPLLHFTDNYINLDDIFTNEANETWERLQATTTLNEKFLVVENVLYRKLLVNRLPNRKLLNAVDFLLQREGATSIESICKEFNVSRKHLNTMFKEYLGVSPKTLSTSYSFQNSLKKISQAKPETFTSFAYEMDFYDQAHFNNSFKKLSGLTPSEYSNLVGANPSMKIVPHFLPSE